MRIKDNFVIKTVAGQSIVAPVGDAALDFNAMISLNDSGAFLWRTLEKDCSEDELVLALISEYDVSEAVAKADVKNFVEEIREANLLDE